jgi:hypothetical protein
MARNLLDDPLWAHHHQHAGHHGRKTVEQEHVERTAALVRQKN